MDKIAMKFLKTYLPVALLLLAPPYVHADVMYQCVDDSGHKSFSNIKPTDKGTKCTAMDLGPAEPAAAKEGAKAAAKTPTPATFPKVDDNAQKARDTDRRRILEGELSTEQANLEQAKKELAQQEANPLPEERVKGGAFNGAKVEERLQPYKDKIALHERNIEAIQKELAKLR